MCVKWTSDWEVTKKDVTAFKAVLRAGKAYTSCVPIRRRDPQQQAGTIGKMLEYRRGRYTVGEEPGIYCFLTPAQARDHHNEEGIAVIQVTIPKGTRVRHGRAIIEDEDGQPLELLTINAMRIKVVKELDEKDVKRALWPQPQRVSHEYVSSTNSITWSYFTCTASTNTSSTFYIAG